MFFKKNVTNYFSYLFSNCNSFRKSLIGRFHEFARFISKQLGFGVHNHGHKLINVVSKIIIVVLRPVEIEVLSYGASMYIAYNYQPVPILFLNILHQFLQLLDLGADLVILVLKLSILVPAYYISSIIPNYHSLRVHHRHYLKHHFLANLLRHWIF